MAGCKYSSPTKEDVLLELIEAFHTLDNYLELNTKDLPDIYYELIVYINKLKEDLEQPEW